MKPQVILETLATVAEINPNGLIRALKQFCPDWVPGPAPTFPNAEYTKTRDSRWESVSVLVARIITGREVSPQSIRSLAKLFDSDKPKQGGTTSGPSGQSGNIISQPDDVSEFYRLQKSAAWKDKPKVAIRKEIATRNAAKIDQTLTDAELTTEEERIKKAIRDYEKKVARRQ